MDNKNSSLFKFVGAVRYIKETLAPSLIANYFHQLQLRQFIIVFERGN